MLRKALLGAIAVLAWSGVAHAETSEADTLFAQGRDLLEKGQLGEACAKLKKSEELAPAVGTLLNLGYCWEQMGRFRSAMESYTEADLLASKTGDAKRSAFAKERIAAVQPKVLKLVVLVAPPVPDGLEIKRNGILVAKSDLGQPIAVDPDEIAVEAVAPGRETWKTIVMGRGEGATITVFVPPLSEQGTTGGSGRPRGGGELPTKRVVALALGGAAVAAIGAGLATGLYAKARHDDSLGRCDATGCDPDAIEVQRSAVAQGNVGTALVVLGLLSGGAGAYLWITGGDDQKPGVRAGLTPNGAVLGGRF